MVGFTILRFSGGESAGHKPETYSQHVSEENSSDIFGTFHG